MNTDKDKTIRVKTTFIRNMIDKYIVSMSDTDIFVFLDGIITHCENIKSTMYDARQPREVYHDEK